MSKTIGTSVIKNTSVMMIAQIITWISSFFLLMFLPRYLGSEQFGQLYLAISICFILSITIDFGGSFLIPREIGRDKNRTPKLLVSYMSVRVIIWIIALICILIFAHIVDYEPTVKWLLLILGISKLWEGIYRALRGGFQGHELMEYPSLGRIVERVSVAAVAVSALLLGAGPIVIGIIMMGGLLLKMLVTLYFVPKIMQHFPEINWKYALILVKSSLPFFLWALFSEIYYRIDTVMLSLLTTNQVVGWYGSAYKLFEVVMFLPNIYTTVVFAMISRMWKEDDERLNPTLHKSIKFLFLAALPISISMFYFSENLVQLFFGLEEYGASIFLLKIFSFSILLIYIDFILSKTILASNKHKKWVLVGLSAIFLNVALNYVSIPLAQQIYANGGIGAAAATFCTELFIMICALWLLGDQNLGKVRFDVPLKALTASGLMVATLWGSAVSQVFWMVQGVLGFLVYGGMLYVLNVFSQRELYLFQKFLSLKTIRNS